jgi:glycosyltransferase involved in cell wall biosynthesis
LNITACIITNNNPAVINCLKSIENTCNEIILVNTVPEFTLDISEFKNVKLFQFEWCNDFSKARNYSLSKATGDWILVIDSDEILTTNIIYLDPKYDAYFVKQVNMNRALYNTRLFKNNIGFYYKNKVHETIEHHINTNNTAKSGIEILHNGYELTHDEWKAKQDRNYNLMLTDYDNNIRNYHLGTYEMVRNKNISKALEFFNLALKDELNNEHIASIYNSIYLCQLMLEYPLAECMETLGKSIKTLPMQLIARINIVENFMNGITDENKSEIIPVIESELDKIETIRKDNLSELHTDVFLNENFYQTKKEELIKWQ